MERKFKHKLTNKVIKIGGKTGLSCQTLIGNSNLILGDIIKGEDWEPVFEKDYEILKTGHILCDIEGGFDKYPILSVKRLSDGEIFTVGDKITSSSFSKSSDIDIINNFYIPDERFCKMWNNRFTINDLIIRTKKSWQSNLCNVIKIKQPLFKTEDYVDIYEKNKDVYYVNINFTLPIGNTDPKTANNSLKDS